MKYLSFVVTTRNDGQDGQELRRMQAFVDALSEQCANLRLEAELVLVEWNPPADHPLLVEALKWPHRSAGGLLIRIIRVPPEIHCRFEHSDIIPLFQMIAKNVGIRRASGQFVLATNIDILFSDELMQWLASGGPHANRMYRANRYDVPASIPMGLPVKEQLDWCARHVTRAYRHHDTVEVVNGILPPPRVVRETPRQKVKRWLGRAEPPLFTNACGDFTLMASRHWRALAGYPEFPLRAMKIDGLLCYAAHYAGVREYVLPNLLRIYHLEHPARGDGASVALAERRSPDPGLQLSLAQYGAWIETMRRTHRPLIFNGEQWGLSGTQLPEIVVSG